MDKGTNTSDLLEAEQISDNSVVVEEVLETFGRQTYTPRQLPQKGVRMNKDHP
jgi:hypothetical protein